MKTKTLVVTCVAVALIGSVVFEYGRAASESTSPTSRIGVVSIQTVFQLSKRRITHRDELLAEQAKFKTQLDELTAAVSEAEGALQTMRPGTDEALQQVKTVIDKRKDLEALQDYIKQHRLAKEKEWNEKLYQDVIQVVKKLATAKGLDLVLERTEPQPTLTSEQLLMVMNTHKVLAADGCVDLTQEVVAQLDEGQ